MTTQVPRVLGLFLRGLIGAMSVKMLNPFWSSRAEHFYISHIGSAKSETESHLAAHEAASSVLRNLCSLSTYVLHLVASL